MPTETPTPAPTPPSCPDPDKVQRAEKGLKQAMKEISDLTAKNNPGPVDKPTLDAGLQALTTAITSVPTHNK